MNRNRMAEIGALLGEPARAAMLEVLMDGRALTAGELAAAAGITPQTASGHLARLTTAALLTVEKQGRHRYHRLAGPEVAQLLEGLMELAAAGDGGRPRAPQVGPRGAAMRAARTCYDHLAGRLGVAIADGLVAQGAIELADGVGLVTEQGLALLHSHGIDPGDGGARTSRPLCRPCLDWSERRPHLAGRLGAAICRHSLEQGWVRRLPDTRALQVTPKGQAALRAVFGVERLE